MKCWPLSLRGFEAEQRCDSEPSRLQTSQGYLDHAQLAIDGKTVRATSKQTHPVHLLSCYDVTTGIVLWHCNVGEKQNEISALKPLLTPSLVKGRILSLDAMHTQRACCAQIHWGGGDYVLMAKDNQPTLAEDIADPFADPCASSSALEASGDLGERPRATRTSTAHL